MRNVRVTPPSSSSALTVSDDIVLKKNKPGIITDSSSLYINMYDVKENYNGTRAALLPMNGNSQSNSPSTETEAKSIQEPESHDISPSSTLVSQPSSIPTEIELRNALLAMRKQEANEKAESISQLRESAEQIQPEESKLPDNSSSSVSDSQPSSFSSEQETESTNELPDSQRDLYRTIYFIGGATLIAGMLLLMDQIRDYNNATSGVMPADSNSSSLADMSNTSNLMLSSHEEPLTTSFICHVLSKFQPIMMAQVIAGTVQQGMANVADVAATQVSELFDFIMFEEMPPETVDPVTSPQIATDQVLSPMVLEKIFDRAPYDSYYSGTLESLLRYERSDLARIFHSEPKYII